MKNLSIIFLTYQKENAILLRDHRRMRRGIVMEMRAEIEKHLNERIIPFWEKLADKENGGFYGYMGYDLVVDRKAVKGCILNSRITWFFSAAAKYYEKRDPEKASELLAYARHGYEFMRSACCDAEFGGMLWSVTYDGQPEDTTKHTYNQAFSIYALAAYYDATGDMEALRLALEIYSIIETKCRDEGGYLEAFDRAFRPSCNDKLSENGVIAERTMNTALHVLEAYTELYRMLVICEREGKETGGSVPAREVGEKLVAILRIFADKMYNQEKHRQEVFFDHEYNTLIDLISYGHDIESSWLIDRTVDVIRATFAGTDLTVDRITAMAAEPAPVLFEFASTDETMSGVFALLDRVNQMDAEMLENVTREAFDGHSLAMEAENGVKNEDRIWWAQGEMVTAFYNGWQHDPARTEYKENAEAAWEFVRDVLTDRREGSEWFWLLDRDGKPYEDRPIVEPWKCPYHNGRMCLEMMRRLG